MKVKTFGVLLIFLVVFTVRAEAQLAIHSNLAYSNIRNDISIENKEALLGYNYGISIQYYPFRNTEKLSLINELNISRKGYRQKFEEEYEFKFNYLSFPVVLDYSLTDNVSLQTGLEPSWIIDSNVEELKDTYNKFDLALILGASFFNQKRWSLYTRFTYGVLPMLDYQEIDDLGNFKDEVHDLKNISVAIGIKINISNEKVSFK